MLNSIRTKAKSSTPLGKAFHVKKKRLIYSVYFNFIQNGLIAHRLLHSIWVRHCFPICLKHTPLREDWSYHLWFNGLKARLICRAQLNQDGLTRQGRLLFLSFFYKTNNLHSVKLSPGFRIKLSLFISLLRTFRCTSKLGGIPEQFGKANQVELELGLAQFNHVSEVRERDP